MTKRFIAPFLVCLVLVFSFGCDRTKLQKVVSATSRIERACPRVESLLVEFQGNGSIDPDKAETFLTGIRRVKLIVGEFNQTARKYVDVTEEAKPALVQALRDVAESLDRLHRDGLLSIKSPQARNRFSLALNLALFALDEVEAELGPLRPAPRQPPARASPTAAPAVQPEMLIQPKPRDGRPSRDSPFVPSRS